MNKLTKIGVSALCGSLASVAAAQAGALSVTGGATATFSSNEGTTTGNPIGLSSGILFTGTGELDNGTTFTLTLSQTDQSAYSAGSIALVTPGLGTFTIDQGAGGTGIDRYDDMIPTAWEETNGTSLGTGLQTVGGSSGSANVEWNVGSDMLPEGLSVALSATPKQTGLGANDKASKSGGDGLGGGWDVAVAHSGLYDGLNVFAGHSNLQQEKSAALNGGNRTQYVLGATYAVGGATFGYQVSRDNMQNEAAGAKSAYDNEAYGVSFSVNDDLSISYGRHKSTAENNGAVNVTNEAESLQLSYTIGGASIKFAETSVEDANYTSGTSKDRDGTTVALSLAF